MNIQTITTGLFLRAETIHYKLTDKLTVGNKLSGIYIISDADSNPLYVGMSASINARLNTHRTNLRANLMTGSDATCGHRLPENYTKEDVEKFTFKVYHGSFSKAELVQMELAAKESVKPSIVDSQYLYIVTAIGNISDEGEVEIKAITTFTNALDAKLSGHIGTRTLQAMQPNETRMSRCGEYMIKKITL